MKKSLLLLIALSIFALPNVTVYAQLLPKDPIEVSFKDTDFDLFESENVYILKTDKSSPYSEEMGISLFFKIFGELLEKHHDEFDKDILVTHEQEVVDSAGTKTVINDIIAYYSLDKINSIDFSDGSWDLSAEIVYKLADAVKFAESFEDLGKYKSVPADGSSPDEYYYLLSEGR